MGGLEASHRTLAGAGTSLTSLADGADLLLTDASEQGLATNVAEYYDIPLAALHIFPIEPGGTDPHVTKAAEDAQRRALGLPEETGSSPRRSLEIQAYDELFFPGWQPTGRNTTSDDLSLAG